VAPAKIENAQGLYCANARIKAFARLHGKIMTIKKRRSFNAAQIVLPGARSAGLGAFPFPHPLDPKTGSHFLGGC
jgi:hypothetical protein